MLSSLQRTGFMYTRPYADHGKYIIVLPKQGEDLCLADLLPVRSFILF